MTLNQTCLLPRAVCELGVNGRVHSFWLTEQGFLPEPRYCAMLLRFDIASPQLCHFFMHWSFWKSAFPQNNKWESMRSITSLNARWIVFWVHHMPVTQRIVNMYHAEGDFISWLVPTKWYWLCSKRPKGDSVPDSGWSTHVWYAKCTSGLDVIMTWYDLWDTKAQRPWASIPWKCFLACQSCSNLCARCGLRKAWGVIHTSHRKIPSLIPS